MTNAEARCNKSLRPRKPEGSLGRTAQDVHLDSHTAPELWRSRPSTTFNTLDNWAINPHPIKKKKDRKEKVIGSWPGTCIQYTRLQTKHGLLINCYLNEWFFFLFTVKREFFRQCLRYLDPENFPWTMMFKRSNCRKYSAKLFSSWRRANKAMSPANFTRVSKALVDTSSLVLYTTLKKFLPVPC